jgi:colicin import membrane protein
MRNWAAPASASPGIECVIDVRQLRSGDVVSATVGRCNGDEAVRRSIEAAVLKASPLPQPEDPNLFNRDLRITFQPEE